MCGCKYKNKWGSFKCKCSGNRLYMKDQDTCIGKCPEKQLRHELYHILIYMFLFLQREADQESGGSSHLLFYLQLQAFVQLVTCSTSIVSGYVFLHVCFSLQTFTFIIMSVSNDIYCVKTNVQSYMDSEIMTIMSQYMPLDSQNTNDPMTGEPQQQQLRLTSAA